MVSEREFPITDERRNEIEATAENWLKDLEELTKSESEETIEALTEILIFLEEKTGQPFPLPSDNQLNPNSS
jgi:hypothetical protein